MAACLSLCTPFSLASPAAFWSFLAEMLRFPRHRLSVLPWLAVVAAHSEYTVNANADVRKCQLHVCAGFLGCTRRDSGKQLEGTQKRL